MLTLHSIVSALADPAGVSPELMQELDGLLAQYPSFQGARLLRTASLFRSGGEEAAVRRALHDTALLLPSTVAIYGALYPSAPSEVNEASESIFSSALSAFENASEAIFSSASTEVNEAPESTDVACVSEERGEAGVESVMEEPHYTLPPESSEEGGEAIGIIGKADPEAALLNPIDELRLIDASQQEQTPASDGRLPRISRMFVETISAEPQDTAGTPLAPPIPSWAEDSRETVVGMREEGSVRAGAGSREIDLRGVIDRSLGQQSRFGATLFTLEAGREQLENSDLAFVTTTLNPQYDDPRAPLREQHRRIDSFLENLDAMQADLQAKMREGEPLPLEESAENLNARACEEMPDVCSERMAKLLEAQGDSAGAIAMYRRLMLEKSEKSVYFAAQIARLEGEAPQE